MNIILNSLEELEQIPKTAVGQLVKLPGDIVKQAVGSVVGGKKVDPLTGIEIPSQAQVQKLKRKEKKLKIAAIPYARDIIYGLQKPQEQKIPTYIGGKPGFSQEKAVKQMESLDQKKKELPPPIAAVKRKFGTGERKHGVGG